MEKTTKPRKSIRRKIWWSNHFLEAVVAIMITAFFSVYLYEKGEERNYRLSNTQDHIMFDNRIYTLSIILVNDPNTDVMLKNILLDYIKEYNKTRSGS